MTPTAIGLTRHVPGESHRIGLAPGPGRIAPVPQCLSIDFLPNAVYRAETCIRATMEAAKEFHFPHDRIMFEVTRASS